MPLPAWRILLPRLVDQPADLEEEMLQALLAVQEKQEQQPVAWEEVSSWSANQNEGSLTLFFADNTEMSIRIQIIGTFNGDTFMWAWNNPSVREELKNASLRLKEYGEQRGWQLFSEPFFPALPRDGFAMAALACRLSNAEGVYCGNNGGTATYFMLSEIPDSVQLSQEQPEFESLSPLESNESSIAALSASVQLEIKDLALVESICRRAFVQSQAGEHLAAVESLDQAWEHLGAHACDQEPAGWIKLARGNSLFLAGKIEEALKSLLEAAALPGCPDTAFLYERIGQCYMCLNEKDRAKDMYARLYVLAGAKGLDRLAEVDRRLFEAELNKRGKKARISCKTGKVDYGERKLNQAAAVVLSLIRELHTFELDAHARQERASQHRSVESELCNEDLAAREKINTNFAWLMAVWCTPGRSPFCSVIQFPPSHDPKSEQIDRVYSLDSKAFAVETANLDPFGFANRFRYELEEIHELMFVRQIYSVWEDEEFPSI